MARRSRTSQQGGGTTTAGTRTASPWERYRVWIIAAGVVAVVAIVAWMAFSSATASAYTCEDLLEAPADRAVDEVDGAGLLGFVVPDTGRAHSEGGIDYVTCPPTSGSHRAGGALDRAYYGPGREQVPNDWVHNLEHGYAVIAYSGDPGSDVLGQIRAAMDAAEPSDVAVACDLPNKVLAVRFDRMSEPFAVLAWDRALLLEEWDQQLATRAATEFQDLAQSPERAC